MSSTGPGPLPVSPSVLAALARGRALFNRGEFWASHEALESAWNALEPPGRDVVQGIIQAAAAFHKAVVQANAEGAVRLLDRSIEKIAQDDGHLGLALEPLVGQLRVWRHRLADGQGVPVIPTGLPRLEWTSVASDALVRVDSVELWRLDRPESGVIVIRVGADGSYGYSEACLSWERRGVWESLAEALGPALLAEPVMAPSELPVLWNDVVESACARAGLEAAVWDLWCRRLGLPLRAALGLADVVPSLSVWVEPEGVGPEELPLELSRRLAAAADAGWDAAIVPLRPNADFRLAEALVSPLPLVFALDGQYRRADFKALERLGISGSVILADPFPDNDVIQAARLRRLVEAPVSLALHTAEAVESAFMGNAFDAVHLDPGRAGITETLRIADFLEERALPGWIRGSARTRFGAAVELALAGHPALRMPSEVPWLRLTPDPAAKLPELRERLVVEVPADRSQLEYLRTLTDHSVAHVRLDAG